MSDNNQLSQFREDAQNVGRFVERSGLRIDELKRQGMYEAAAELLAGQVFLAAEFADILINVARRPWGFLSRDPLKNWRKKVRAHAEKFGYGAWEK